MEIDKLHNLNNHLNKVASIREKYEYRDQILGKKFNIFRILKKGHEEVSLHSAFVGELLNPKGLHKKENSFLTAFIDIVVNGNNVKFDSDSNYKVSIEKAFKYSNTQGRMDIIIENDNNCIIIENKIWAQDQNEQLGRYYQYAKKFENFYILYLTLWGADPSNNSTRFEGEEIPKDGWKAVSYQEDILSWLDKCSNLAIDKAYIRENIQQYIDLIKELTGTMEDNMSDEVKKYVSENMSVESLKELKNLKNVLGEIRIEKIGYYLNEITKKVIENKNSENWEIKSNLLRFNNKAKEPIKSGWDLPHRIELNVNDTYIVAISIWTEYGSSGIWTAIKPLDNSNTQLHNSLTNYFREKPEISTINEEKKYIHFNVEKLDFYFDYLWKDMKYLDQKIEKTVEITELIIDALKEFENME